MPQINYFIYYITFIYYYILNKIICLKLNIYLSIYLFPQLTNIKLKKAYQIQTRQSQQQQYLKYHSNFQNQIYVQLLHFTIQNQVPKLSEQAPPPLCSILFLQLFYYITYVLKCLTFQTFQRVLKYSYRYLYGVSQICGQGTPFNHQRGKDREIFKMGRPNFATVFTRLKQKLNGQNFFPKWAILGKKFF
eukprot:TRINITY_DN9839_c1_g1_i3.p1 TRINITY_DN9839_c1_g1~~TRINITY_DN9839_c1_g1_i3.p1  ORF type:complete len:220 (+),score=-35.93 TRINITY_DN9839_c1_g1_i3:92-661(+)